MKLTKYFMPLAAIALLASCSNDKLEGLSTSDEQTSKEGLAYLNLSIATPAIPGTKADPYDDGSNTGTYQEYAVKDATLYLFSYDSNTIGDCKAIIDLTASFSDEGKNNLEVTSKATETKIKLPADFDTSKDYKALVVINKDALTSTPVIGMAFSGDSGYEKSVQKKMMDQYETQNYYFAMTNALGWVDADVPQNTSNFKPEVLVTIPSTKFYFESETNQVPDATQIYVQRVAAKVSIDGSSAINFTTPAEVKKGTQSTGDYVKMENWWLNVVNEETYPVQILGSWSNTLIPNWAPTTSLTQPLDRFTTGSTFHRVNWCEDANYTTTSDALKTTYMTAPTQANTDKNALYCMENTMQKNNMKQNQTTTAYFKATYYHGSNSEAKSFVAYNGKYYDVDDTDLVDGLQKKSQTEEIEKILKEDALSKAAEALGISVDSNIKVDFYYKGECYYKALLRHFNDNELSDSSKKVDEWVNQNGYSSEDDKYFLGRYGVVRNNWYELSLNGVSAPGLTEIPTPGDQDDDDREPKVLDCTVNILSWTKHKQDVSW